MMCCKSMSHRDFVEKNRRDSLRHLGEKVLHNTMHWQREKEVNKNEKPNDRKQSFIIR